MLKLKQSSLDGDRATVTYDIVHNVGSLPTTLTNNLSVAIDSDHKGVTLSLDVDKVSAGSLDEGREILAMWCERLAAGLRHCERSDALLPVYQKKPFDVKAQPKWLRQEFNRVCRKIANAHVDDWEGILAAMTTDRHPLSLIPGAYDSIRRYAVERLDE